MPLPVRLCVVKVGGTCARVFAVRGLGGTVVVTPLLWKYGCRRGRMTGVISSQGVVPMLLLTVHGHVHHVDGSEYHSWGPCGSPPCLRVPRGPRVRRKHAAGGRTLLMTPWGFGRGGEMSPEMPIMPEASPQSSDKTEFAIRALSS
jgi:hypothetical protein